MGKKCKKCECPAGEKWAVPLADFLSLLLALFIALYALASVNTEKMKALKEEFVKIYDYSAKPEETNPVVRMSSKSGDAAKGQQMAENLCKTYGVTPDQALEQACKFFHI